MLTNRGNGTNCAMIAQRDALIASYIAAGFALVPIPHGCKGPRAPGWNVPENAITSADDPRLSGDGNIGLLHAYSAPPTCALDVDDLDKARTWFAERGIDLDTLLADPDAVRIHSGQPGRAKLLYRLQTPLQSCTLPWGELRCASSNGTTWQDVLPPSIHPSGHPYELTGDPSKIQMTPNALLKIWRNEIANKATARGTASVDLAPIIDTGTALDLPSFELTEKQLRLTQGLCEGMDRSTVVHGLLIALIDQGAPPADVLATITSNQYLWQYCLDHRNNDPERALTFANEELQRANASTRIAKRQQLAFFNEAWQDAVPAVAIKPSPSVDFHFDARPLTLDVLRKPIAKREFAIEPHLPRGVLTEFSGAHGISKSTLALDQALSVATSRKWCGLPTMTGRAVFASREDSHEEILRRVQAWLRSLDPKDRPAAEQAICENLTLLGRDETTGLALTTKTYGACSVRRDAIALVAERCQGAVLVVLETASRLHGGDELNEDLAQLAEAMERIASLTGAAVMLIRHVSKAAARDKNVDSYAGRGGGALSDAARSVLVLAQLTPEQARERGIALDGLATVIGSPIIALHHAKASYSPPAAPIYFMRSAGPVLRQVMPPDREQAFGERLIAYMRERQGEELSTRQITQDARTHNVPQRQVADILAALEQAGRIKGEKVKRRGGPCTIWTPIYESESINSQVIHTDAAVRAKGRKCAR